ncbi:VpsF family polysaccharide biosynthesis protein [Bradyrhizobium murdochi]|uniref:VpsF family polysaccharide biosynthesis protein n=1 Tax=Bradyrhizobium murdochi TaxID=1038859 RepID=UPI000403B976|nr:VpsF family polysaccharide biosynthesis protein [Bradyrhizobium murdochi]
MGGRVANADAFIERIATGLMLLAVMATFTLSSSVLTNWKIHYLTSGGNFLEKLHPVTYFTLLAFSLLLMRSRGPVGEINRMFSESKLLLAYLLCWLFLLVQVIVLARPFTVIIDTFLLPILIAMVMWQLSPAQRRPLAWAIHLTILLNVVLGYYEYFSGHRLIPLTLGDVVVMGEWRSAALLGHPLTASGIVGGYVLALALRPAICPPILLRLPLIAFCLGSLMAFGGRTALVTVLGVLGLIGAFEMVRLIQGKRTQLPAAILAICVLFAAGAIVFAALDLGIFDKMLLRFSSDKGSALARFATFNLLSHFDWNELILGPNPVRVNALQSQLGLNYGIENFWISAIVQFGLIHTVVLTIGLICFFVELLRRSSAAAWAIVLLIIVIAASSVSFSSKNIQLAQFVILISVLLPREQRRIAVPPQVRAPVTYRSVLA